MRTIRCLFLFLALSLVLTISVACSSSGKGGTGSPEDYDPMGDGNIPLAEPGSELSDVHFQYDSSNLPAQAKQELRDNAQWMLDNPDTDVVVEGHADERGTAEYNMALGMRRAESVYEFLRSLGVESSQMSRVSYGEELPLDPGHGPSAWAQNRRAHFSIK